MLSHLDARRLPPRLLDVCAQVAGQYLSCGVPHFPGEPDREVHRVTVLGDRDMLTELAAPALK